MTHTFSKVINLFILFKLSHLKATEGLCNLLLSILARIKVATEQIHHFHPTIFVNTEPISNC